MSLIWGAWFDPTKQHLILEHLQVDKLPNLIGLAVWRRICRIRLWVHHRHFDLRHFEARFLP